MREYSSKLTEYRNSWLTEENGADNIRITNEVPQLDASFSNQSKIVV